MRTPPRGRGIAAVTLSLLALAATAHATAHATPSPAPSSRTTAVTYHGLTVDVPSTWQVVDLEAAPDTCVRFDRTTVYLGHPGAEQSCPSHLVGGRTDALVLEPIDGAAGEDVASALRVPAGAPMPSRLPDSFEHDARIAIEGAGILATAAYGASDEGVAAVLRSARLDATAKAAPLPPKAVAAQRTTVAGLAAATGYTGLGFDTCSAPSSSAMNAWKASPYRAVGIYIGGRNRGCPKQPQLTSGWVSEQVANGWHLLPIFVDLQAGGISPANAVAQGRESADAAVADAAALGLAAGTGTVIYNDMEEYKDRSYAAGCSTTSRAGANACTSAVTGRACTPAPRAGCGTSPRWPTTPATPSRT